MKIGAAMAELEERRGGTLLVFAASNLELELLPALYDSLRAIGRTRRLDVLLYCRGGIVNAARRIALMLNDFTDHLAFIVPDRCESSGTIATLAGREIVAGPAAIFSPIDPALEASATPSGGGPSAVSAEDVRLFGKMAGDWFGIDETEAARQALSALCDSIFPTTLTSFYRATLEVREICEELLSLHMPDVAGEAKSRIVERLLFGHHSHSFALTAGDLAGLGLPVRRDTAIEDLGWEVANDLRATIGGGVRTTDTDDWVDALLVTRGGGRRRRRSPGVLAPAWEEVEIE